MSGTMYLSQMVMRNPEISVKAKALYAYLCAIAGENEGVVTEINDIMEELAISKTLYYKNLHELIDIGVLEIEKTKGGRNENIYQQNIFWIRDGRTYKGKTMQVNTWIKKMKGRNVNE